eukprot:2589446-Rhodomonas_salina.2
MPWLSAREPPPNPTYAVNNSWSKRSGERRLQRIRERLLQKRTEKWRLAVFECGTGGVGNTYRNLRRCCERQPRP